MDESTQSAGRADLRPPAAESDLPRRGDERQSGRGRSVGRRPTETELRDDPAWGHAYHRELIRRVPGDCVLEVLEGQLFWLCELSGHLSTEQVDRVHPPYGWTIRQVFEHVADAERVFGERMMRIASGDPLDLPNWDENACADSRFGLGGFGHLVSEIAVLRQANLLLLRRVVPKAWDRVGKVNGQPLSLRAAAWFTAGHLSHHFEIVEGRCGLRVRRTGGQ